MKVNDSLEWLARQMFPPRCRCCGAPGRGRFDLCGACYRDLPRLTSGCRCCAEPMAAPGLLCGRCLKRPPAFARVLAPYRYAPPLDRLILEFKFQGRLASGRLLGELLGRWLAGQGVGVDGIVPVPLHRHRLRERGFNQALELARPLGRRLGLPVVPELLHRVRHTTPQSELTRNARRRNVHRAFQATAAVTGRRLALVDDVLTTASTAEAAARALLAAGAVSVEIWVVARAGGHPAPPQDPG